MFAKMLLTVSLTFLLVVNALPVPHHAREARRELDPRQKSAEDSIKEFGRLIGSFLAQAHSSTSSSSSATASSTASSSSATNTSSRRRRRTKTSSASSTATSTSTTTSTTESSSSTITSSASVSTITSSASSSSASASSSAVSSSQSSKTSVVPFAKPTKKACKGVQNFRKFKNNNRIKHKDPKNTIRLFHATKANPRNVNRLRKGPKAIYKGDFSPKGAFYLTDEITAAAQYACYEKRWRRKTVTVFEYEWQPDQMKIYNFQSPNQTWRAFVNKKGPFTSIANNDIVAGPLRRKKSITRDYWQYAVTSEKGLKNLKLKAIHHNIRCKNIPRGNLC